METLWSPHLWETIRLIVVAAITAFASFGAVWLQNKVKITELNTNVRFKAREHMYLAYEKDLRRSHQNFNNIHKVLGEMIGYGMGAGEELSRGYWQTIRIWLKSIKFDRKIIDQYEKELAKMSLLDNEAKEVLNKIYSTLNENPDDISDDVMPEHLGEIINVLSHFNALDEELLEKKRDEWFSPFIN